MGTLYAVEGIPATITMPATAAKVTCFALGPSGNRKHQIAIEAADGRLQIVLTPECETVWHELDVS